MILTDTYSLYQSDFRVTLSHVERMGGTDLIATSPPYANARTYGMDVDFTDDVYKELAHCVFAALKPGGHALINLDAPVRDWCGDGRGSERGLHPWRFMLYAHDTVGFRVPDRLAFGRHGLPGAYAGRFRNDFEPLLWLQRPGDHTYFDKTALRTQARSKIGGQASARRPDGSVYKRRASGDAVDKGIANRGTLWDYGAVGHGHTGNVELDVAQHPARWPYRLARDIIVCFCRPGGLVCDPFVGAGTTLIAALDEGRRFVGGDIGVRASDGLRWIDVAHDIVIRTARQASLFP